MSALSRAWQLIGSLIVVGLLAACGGTAESASTTSTTAPSLTRIVVDFSVSAMESDANRRARNAIIADLPGIPLNSTVEIIGFTNLPGQQCDPIRLHFPPQANPESEKQLRRAAAQALLGIWDTYAECLRSADTGLSGAGSGILGAIALAATTDSADLTGITVFTDGCTFRETKPGTCSRQALHALGAEQLVAKLPAALKPSISTPITVVGLGRGTGLTAEELITLRSFYAQWGALIGAPLTFEN